MSEFGDDCPNCEENAEEIDTEVESHWTVAYIYECDNCKTRFDWSLTTCDHGFTGWALNVEEWGDPRKSVIWAGKLEGELLERWEFIEDVIDEFGECKR